MRSSSHAPSAGRPLKRPPPADSPSPRVPSEWNATQTAFESAACVHQLFEAQAGRTPGDEALVFEDERLTFGELNARSNRLARRLLRLGVGTDTLVPIVMDRSTGMVVGILGALKAGAAWLPLDPGNPGDRLAFMLSEARPRAILTQERHAGRLTTWRGPVLLPDRHDGETSRESGADLGLEVDSAAIAYAIYTSGSTGRPKGVLIPHAALTNHTLWMQSRFPLGPGDVVVQKTPYTFDAAVWEFFAPLVAGARLVLARPGAHQDPASLARLIDEHGATVLQMVPTGLRALLDEPGGARCPSLRRLFCGGEPLTPELQRRVFDRTGAGLVNLYGPTEACIDSTYWVCDRGGRTVPIGRPIANARAYVLDRRLQPQPVGAAGELFIAGTGLARGYLNRADLTAGRFLPDPFGPDPGARMYATGDRARWLPDGTLEFLGRNDDQVKVRGQRIEPGEIEAVLERHPAVAECAVAATPARDGDAILAAYVTLRAGANGGRPGGDAPAPTVTGLREFLAQTLPESMIPSAFIVLDELPRTPSGKVDRRRLPEPGSARPCLAAPFMAPRSEEERRVAALWSDLLGLDRVGVRDNFFDLGGHSLVATRVMSRVRDLFGVDVPLRALFEAPTVEDLTGRIAAARREGKRVETAPPAPAPPDRERPLSFAQQRLWFLDQLDPGRPFYNTPATLRLRGPLDRAALEKSLDEIVRRHQVLRTVFPAVDGRPLAVVASEQGPGLPFEDLSDRPPDERLPEALRRAQREAQEPFDLARGPLMRSRLLRLDERDHILLRTFHHIVTDGWSEEVFNREMEILYAAFSAGRPSPLPPLPIQYADFAAWQRGALQGDALRELVGYWRGALEGAPTTLDLPTDRPRPPVRGHRGGRRRALLAGRASEALRALARSEGATLFMTVLAAFNVLLQRWTGQDDILVGTPIANRNRIEIEDLIGFFVNTLVLRTDLSGDPTFRDLLRRVRGAALGAYAHQDLPFERLVEELHPSRDLGRTALFQVMVAHARASGVRLEGLQAEFVDIDDGIAKFDLTLDVDDGGERLACDLEYSTDLFDAATAGRMLRRLETLLEGIAADPDVRLSRLPLLPEEERRQVLVEWPSGRQTELPGERCIHELFEARAMHAPEAVAVSGGSGRLTYADLDRRASALARRLVRLGVRPDAPVALCVERSPDMVVGLLGILKAGGTYVPIDPDEPRERIAHLLDDTGARVLLAPRRLLEDLPARGARHLPLEGEGEDGVTGGREKAGAAGDRGGAGAGPENLAYAVYTSGSTGVPKGVLVPHRALVNHSVEMARRYDLGPTDRVLQFASLGFDVAAEEIFPTLLSGATLVLRPEPVFDSIPDFHRFLESEGVTVLNLPASYWHAWVAELARGEEALPACLRCVVIGSEKALADRLETWEQIAGSRVALFNAYGASEATITTTVYEPRGGRSAAANGLVPIGRPIANTRVFVLDRRLGPAPVGVPGELHIGGKGLARGYLGRPDLTAERFIPDPFSPAPGARLYRTGDRARWLPDGNLEFLGRLDDQVKVRGRRIEPAEIERAIATHPAVAEAAVVAREDRPGDTRLVAYVAGDPGAGPGPSVAELRAHLKRALPEPMIPSAFVRLDRLPRTPAGKIDRKALPVPDASPRGLEGEPVGPRNPAEETLARIWAQIFGRERVGVNDNFFELGGDSILSIQIVARANQAGLRLTSRQIFQHQTIAELAAVAGTRAAAPAEQGPVTGEAPLTPIQRWFFERDFADPHHFNQAVLLEARQALDAAALERAFGILLDHHDALRLRYRREGEAWRQDGVAPGGPIPFERVDLSALSPERRPAALQAKAGETQRSLDLADGPLLRAVFFDSGRTDPGRLLIAIHHLVVDGVSWRILLEDLNTVYRQLERGDSIALPPKTTSYKAWAEGLAGHARRAPLDRELDVWLARERRRPGRLPVDRSGGANLEGSARVITSTFTEDETRALLQALPAAWRTEINDVLLTALARAVGEWTGERSVLIDLEGHGREEILDDVDLSRTIGWFTTITPILLTLQSDQAPEEALKSIKEQLRAIPGRGLGFGLLRYLRCDPEIAARLEGLPQAEISFNYLGQFDAAVPASSPFRFAPESTGPVVSPRARRTHLLEIGGYVASSRLRINWKYGEAVHARDTIETLARRFEKALRSLIALGSRPEAAAFTPSDFPLAALDQGALDVLARAHPGIEDIYPLTPMQEGMLFHTLSAPGTGVYVEHLTWTFHGPLDEEAFERAWRRAAGRHPILRTAFVWSGVDRPLQVVSRDAKVSWDRLDWRGLSPEEQERALRDYLAEDMRRGYDLSRPPLMRLAIARLDGTSHRFVWSHHHVLLDGWSLPVLLKEVMALYEGFRRGEEPGLEEPPPFRDYVAWLMRQDLEAAEAYWRRALRGFSSPTPLAVDHPAARSVQPDDYRLVRTRLSRAATDGLRDWARRQQLTLNTVVLGAWGLLLSRYSGEEDVVFGGIVSGRPPDLEGSERMVGLLLNTLPVRVRLRRGEPIVSWLKRLQEEQAEMRQYEYTPLPRVQQWSDVPRGTPLFESVLVFENYPLDAALLERVGEVEIRDLRAVEWTHYPLTVVVPPGPGLSIQINYDARRFDAPAARRMLGHLKTLLEGFAADPRRRPAAVPMTTASERAWLDGLQPRAAPPVVRCLHEMFEAQAARRPDAVAVVCGNERIGYADLDRRANRLARRLRDLGAGPETRVAICLERSLGMIEAILAVLKSGAAYVPLDPAYPRDRLEFMLRDAGAVALISRRGTLEALPEHRGALVLLEAEDAGPEAAGRAYDADPVSGACPESPAYVIYTSGSTGRPKGVAVTHAGVASLFGAMTPEFGFAETDVWTLLHSYAFDYSVWEMWGALLHGGRLVVVPAPVARSPEALLPLLLRERVTVLNQTPSEFRQLALADQETQAELRDLRLVNIGGEALNFDDLRPWMARHPDRPLLVNLYGITETTVIATRRPLRPGDLRERPKSLIGRPIADLRVYLLDPEMQPVPIGLPGEIHIGGPGLARGYLGRPDLTAERFVPDPFSGEPGARLYRSGDLARLADDGELEYLGRMDDQVKIRGYRIEPGEIEAALLAHPAVREAVVVARQDGRTERRLVAYAVPRSGREADAGELREFLRRSLPDHMVPTAFVVLESLPVTPNGKVDRRALPPPDSVRPDRAAPRVPPRTPMEQEVARLWSALIGVEGPGVEDNFFEAGGQSLLATLLISRVRAQLGAEVPLKEFLDDPTIRGLAGRVEQAYLRAAAPSELDALLGLMEGTETGHVEKD